MKLNWKLDGTGKRTAFNENFAFQINVDHVGLNISVARITEFCEWTNKPLVVGEFKRIAFGHTYDHMRQVAEAFTGE